MILRLRAYDGLGLSAEVTRAVVLATTLTASLSGQVAAASGWVTVHLRAGDAAGLSSEAIVHVGVPAAGEVQAQLGGYVREAASLTSSMTGAVRSDRSVTATLGGAVAGPELVTVNLRAYDAGGLSAPAVVHVQAASTGEVRAALEGAVQGEQLLQAAMGGEVREAGVLRLRFETGSGDVLERTVYVATLPRTLTAGLTGSVLVPQARQVQAALAGAVRAEQTIAASLGGFAATRSVAQAALGGVVQAGAAISSSLTGSVAVPGQGSVTVALTGLVQAPAEVSAQISGLVQAPRAVDATLTGLVAVQTERSVEATLSGTVTLPQVRDVSATLEGLVAERTVAQAAMTGTVRVNPSERAVTAGLTGTVVLPTTTQPEPDGLLVAYLNQVLVARRRT